MANDAPDDIFLVVVGVLNLLAVAVVVVVVAHGEDGGPHLNEPGELILVGNAVVLGRPFG